MLLLIFLQDFNRLWGGNPRKSSLVDFQCADISSMIQEEVLELRQLAENKMILILDGNDVGSATAWVMLSSSVPIMVERPEHEHWFMQGLLMPWVHYVPVKMNGSDLEDKVVWCNNHPDKCERIAMQSSAFAYNMWPWRPMAHIIAKGILDEYLRRYKNVIDCYCN